MNSAAFLDTAAFLSGPLNFPAMILALFIRVCVRPSIPLDAFVAVVLNAVLIAAVFGTQNVRELIGIYIFFFGLGGLGLGWLIGAFFKRLIGFLAR
jgi:general stress protein CsbA